MFKNIYNFLKINKINTFLVFISLYFLNASFYNYKLIFITCWPIIKILLPFLLVVIVMWKSITKKIKTDKFLVVLSILIAVFSFFIETTLNKINDDAVKIGKSNVIEMTNDYNCLIAVDVINMFSKDEVQFYLGKFVSDPYESNLDSIFNLYGQEKTRELLFVIGKIYKANALIDIIKSYDIRLSQAMFSEEVSSTQKMMTIRRNDLKKAAEEIRNTLCVSK